MAPERIDDDKELERELEDLRSFIKAHCIITSDQEQLTDSRGRPYAWTFDLRPALLQSGAVRLIAKCFWRRFRASWPFQVAAVELAALPLLGAILSYGTELGLEVNGLAVRRERKTYGRRRAIEGEMADLPIILVDDMFNSGRTLIKSAVMLKEEGAAAAVLYRPRFRLPLGADKLKSLDVSVERMFLLAEFGLNLPPPVDIPKATPPLQVRWRFEPHERRYGFVGRKAAPVIAGKRVFHATEDGWLHAIEAEAGTIAWSLQVAQRSRKGVWSTPAIHGDHLFIGSYDGAVLKVSIGEGKVVWRFEGAEWVGSSPAISADGTSLYVGVEWASGRGEGGIIRLETQTGRLDWELPISAQVHASPILLTDGDIICGANDGLIRRIAPSGEPRWTSSVGADIKGAAALSDDNKRVFVAAFDGGISALNLANGEQLWRVATGGPAFATPLPLNGNLACTSTDGQIRLLDQTTGSLLFSYGAGGKLFAAPVLVGDRLVVGAATGRLLQLSADRLELLAEHQFSERIVSEVAANKHTLFVPSFDGQLFAVSRDEKRGAGL